MKKVPETQGLPGGNDGSLQDEIDKAFDGLLQQAESGDFAFAVDPADDEGAPFVPRPLSQEEDSFARREVRHLFEHILLEYLPPIRDGLRKMQRGDNSTLLHISLIGSIEPLKNAAGQLGNDDLQEHFSRLLDALSELQSQGEDFAYRHIRRVFQAYEDIIGSLSSEVQEQYRIMEEYEAHSIPILDYFITIRGIGPKSIQKLFNAGLNKYEVVRNASAFDVNRVTGIHIRLCEEIIRSLDDYKTWFVLKQSLSLVEGARMMLKACESLDEATLNGIVDDNKRELKRLLKYLRRSFVAISGES